MPTLTTRTIIIGVLVVLAIFAAFGLAFHYSTEVILVFAGIVISISMSPVVEWLHAHKLPRSLSVMLIYACLGVVFVGFIFFVLPQMILQATSLAPKFAEYYDVLISTIQNSPVPYLRQVADQLPASLNELSASAASMADGGAGNTVNWTLNVAHGLAGVLFTLSITLLIGFCWTLEGERVEYAFLLLFPTVKRDSTRELIKNIETRVGGFIRGQSLLALTIGVMALVAYVIIGLPSALPLAFLAGVFEFVPLFGPTLGAIPALLVALAFDPSKIIWVIVATILMQLFENNVLAPRIMQKTVGVSPIITIVSIIGFGFIFGFPGLLVAIPLAAIFQVLMERSLLRPIGSKIKVPEGRDRLSVLRYESQEFIMDIRKLVRRKESRTAQDDSDEIEDAIESIATDLDGLLASPAKSDNAS